MQLVARVRHVGLADEPAIARGWTLDRDQRHLSRRDVHPSAGW